MPASARKKRGTLFTVGVAALVIGAGCCLLSVVLLLVYGGMKIKKALTVATVLPASPPTATSLMVATDLPVTQSALPAPTTFQDDFSRPDSGWMVTSTQDADAGYNPQEFYEMGVKQPNTYLVALAPDNFADPVKNVLLSVRAQPALGDTGEYGLVCRYQDNDNFYLAGISGNQFYIGKQVNGQWIYLTSPKWQTLPDSTPDAQGYQLMNMSCTDSFIVLEVNGIGAAHVTDNEFSSGQVGLAVWAGDKAGKGGYYARAAFDDFSVELSQP
jgi:hypothetical protein